MDAVVLVGGEGTRLRPLTWEIPKQMLPLVGRPMIVHVLEWLAGHGIDRAVLSLGPRAEAFVQAFPSDRLAGVALDYVVEPEPLDTAGAIRFAAEQAGVNDTFLVLNGDVLTELDVSSLVEFHRSRTAQASIALTPVADPSRFGVVPTDAQGRVTAFIEKPQGEAPTNLINAGIYVLETSVLDRIANDRRVSIERETFPELVAAGTLYALASEAYWLDTGTPQQFLQAQFDILSGRRLSRPPAPEIRTGVWVDPSAEIAGKLGPHSYVGPRASIAEGAAVSDSVVGAGSRIGPDGVIGRSLLMSEVEVRSGATVEDSIVGPRAVIGEDARLTGMTIVGAGAKVPAGSVLDGARHPLS
ncbi:MAG: sugar phosphate nucleotidyltransferase [Acidimicrobiales bacterium]|jgi:NDP-sugar pyrophosphorylase family protein